MQYAIVIEKSATGYGAYVPDLPGCVAVSEIEAEVRKLICEGIEIYLDETKQDGEPIPTPTARVEYVSLTEAASAAPRHPPHGRGVAMEYAAVIEKESTSYGAYVPDLPGCVAVGESEAEVRQLIRQAIVFHLQGMRLNGEFIPRPTSRVDYVTVPESAPAV